MSLPNFRHESTPNTHENSEYGHTDMLSFIILKNLLHSINTYTYKIFDESRVKKKQEDITHIII
tara:strand:+ start:163 stop:354 length:192 start_codon:yes stop_codon:yes gene_type:complete